MNIVKNIFKSLFVTTLIIVSLFGFHIYSISGSNKNVSPEFQSYYDNFIKEANKRGFYHVSKMNITIEFKNVEKRFLAISSKGTINLGHCSLIIGQDPHIQVDALQWAKSNIYQREMVIFHELAHCFLFKGHTEGHDKDGVHKSLMGSLAFSSQEYKANRDKFVDELFSYKPYHAKDYVHTFFIDGWEEKTKEKWDSGVTLIANVFRF